MVSFPDTELKRKNSMSDKNKLDHLTDQLAQDYLHSPELIEVSFMTRLECLIENLSEKKVNFSDFNESVMNCTVANHIAINKAKLLQPAMH